MKKSSKNEKPQIVYVSLDEIKPYERNPRFNDIAVNEVAKSIREFGFRQPIVIDENNVIIIGHTRYKAARFLGLESVPVIVERGLTEKQTKALRIADNKLGEMSSWDFGKLGEEMQGFSDIEYAAKNTGFNMDFIQSVMPDVGKLAAGGDQDGSDSEIAPLFYSRVQFRDNEQKERFMAMLFELRKRYPDEPTNAGRFLAFIREFSE